METRDAVASDAVVGDAVWIGEEVGTGEARVDDAIAACAHQERRQMVQGALVWRILGVGMLTGGYVASTSGPTSDAVALVAAAILVYNLLLFVAVRRRADLVLRATPWVLDGAVVLLANLVAAALLPEGSLFREYHDVVWPAWLGVVYVWTVLEGWRAGIALMLASVVVKFAMAAANGIPPAQVDVVTVGSRIGWSVVGILLVSFVLLRAERWAELAGATGMRSGLEVGSAERERLHHVMHTDGLGALETIRKLAQDAETDDGRLPDIAHIARETENYLRRQLERLDRAEGPLEERLRDRARDLAATYRAEPPRMLIETDETFDLPDVAATTLLHAMSEALVNTYKHVGTSARTQVILRPVEDAAAVIVIDDGPGLDPATTELRGLAKVRGDLERLGGSAVVGTSAKGGTRWEFRAPRSGSTRPTGAGGV